MVGYGHWIHLGRIPVIGGSGSGEFLHHPEVAERVAPCRHGNVKVPDLIGVTFLARVGVALHTDRWWYAYLLVVVYIVYKLINLVLAWVRAGDTKQQVAEDDKASLSRKERRAREKQEKKLRKRNK